MTRRPLLPVVLAAVCVLSACFSTPVRVERADPRDVHREITGNVLTTGKLSARTRQFLERNALRESFKEYPAQTLAAIHGELASEGDHRRISALAELSFYHAERTHDRRYFLLSAAYAYALLFPGPDGETLDVSDPRLRLAYDLYNRGLTEALIIGEEEIVLRAGTYELPIGSVEVELPESELVWAGHELRGFIPAADLDVHGIRNRYRRSGIGAPLSARLGPEIGPEATPTERFVPGIRVPATVVLRFDDPRGGLEAGRLVARAEIYTPDESSVVSIDGHKVPIEFETTSSLASALADSPFWEFEMKGFFSGTFKPLREAVVGTSPITEQDTDEGLLFLSPYRKGHIPLVLVHGTASSPARWADLVNEIENDRAIADRYQVWLFLYNTGNPIGYSGGLLRRSLEAAIADLDPDGVDPALRRMVVAGHSQGGLLTKLTAIDSGDRFWDIVANAPLAALDLAPDVRETLRMSTYFTPEPFVERVIFVCTPHHGSYLAALRMVSLSPAQWVSDLVALPANLGQVFTELVTRNPDKLILRTMTRLPTSIDNMTPGNPFIKTLAEIPIAPGIVANSIVAVRADGPLQDGTDGVVRYDSAHIEGVESELVVRSSHSAQGRPETILEIRRILLEHVRAR